MAIEIRIESTWDTDDGEGRRVEVTVSERSHPSEDVLEHSRFFASGDTEALKRYLGNVIDEKASFFIEPDSRECVSCGRVVSSPERREEVVCGRCRARS